MTEANGNLSNKREKIGSAVKTAEKYVFLKLKIDWSIDVLATNRIPMIIPENGADGYTMRLAGMRITSG